MKEKERKLLIVGGFIRIYKGLDVYIPKEIECVIFQFYDIKLDTTILNESEVEYIYNILANIGDIDDFKLLLRASEDGFDANSFHKLCDYKSPILSIIISNEGDIFGGYSNKEWINGEYWISDIDCKSFIFVLRDGNDNNNDKIPFKWFIKNDCCDHAVYDYHDGFGYGLDIFVGWNANIKKKRSNQRLGHSYGPYKRYKTTKYFDKLVDYEIWQIVYK